LEHPVVRLQACAYRILDLLAHLGAAELLLAFRSDPREPCHNALADHATFKLGEAMQCHSTGRLYLNFPGHGEDADLVRQAHGTEVYARLVAIKRTYDPANFFRMNQHIGIA
jgi:FAD/FMN-containing dehydrogenase